MELTLSVWSMIGSDSIRTDKALVDDTVQEERYLSMRRACEPGRGQQRFCADLLVGAMPHK